jgi:DNA-directed RNA polymerase specialized sigma24 family protein
MSMRTLAPPEIEDLYRDHALGLVRFALLLTGDRAAAEDIVQDAFLGLHQRRDKVRDPGRMLGYLRIAVVNGSRSRHRARWRYHLNTVNGLSCPAVT